MIMVPLIVTHKTSSVQNPIIGSRVGVMRPPSFQSGQMEVTSSLTSSMSYIFCATPVTLISRTA